jgi:flagellar basal-body rod modification protein FlgD
LTRIGRPDAGPNEFRNVQMAKPENSKKVNGPKSVGDQLNSIAGIREESKFVDRKNHNKMDKDAFMKLLAHQMSNQDPMNPMDQKQFAADLAQFSQLEQLTNMNARMEKTTEGHEIQERFQGATFLGKRAITGGATVQYNGEDTSVSLPFYLPNNARQMVVRIFDSKNQMIGRIEKENVPAGGQTLAWDGVSLDGTRAIRDTYRFDVEAWDEKLQSFKGETRAAGIVTSVAFENGEMILTVDGKNKVFLRDVKSFELPNGNSGAAQNMPGLKKAAASSYAQMKEAAQ